MPRTVFAAPLILVLLCLPGMAGAEENASDPDTPAQDAPAGRSFSRFAAQLPPGWDGEERTGFSSGAPEEYMLVLGVQDEAAERFLAQVSVFVLPNRKGTTAEDFARQMAELQGDPTEPREEGRFWTFEGEPRTQALRGRGTTSVAATPERLLIIITQDPEHLGGKEVAASLRGLDDETRGLLGR
ncbi:MAG: protoporphyrinogen oxidase [Desulfovibrio sp.]|nr:protoporphyrinogen oxidase [Desulfovibrio sp.]